jgi:hypothetical protein
VSAGPRWSCQREATGANESKMRHFARGRFPGSMNFIFAAFVGRSSETSVGALRDPLAQRGAGVRGRRTNTARTSQATASVWRPTDPVRVDKSAVALDALRIPDPLPANSSSVWRCLIAPNPGTRRPAGRRTTDRVRRADRGSVGASSRPTLGTGRQHWSASRGFTRSASR